MRASGVFSWNDWQRSNSASARRMAEQARPQRLASMNRAELLEGSRTLRDAEPDRADGSHRRRRRQCALDHAPVGNPGRAAQRAACFIAVQSRAADLSAAMRAARSRRAMRIRCVSQRRARCRRCAARATIPHGHWHVAGMYREWGRKRRMRVQVLREGHADGRPAARGACRRRVRCARHPATRSGFARHGGVRRRRRLQRLTARVRVAPQPTHPRPPGQSELDFALRCLAGAGRVEHHRAALSPTAIAAGARCNRRLAHRAAASKCSRAISI